MPPKGIKKIKWKENDELIEFVKLLIPYMTYADIGRLVNRNRRTIHRLVKEYGLEKYKKNKQALPLIIIKDRDKYENDLLTLKDFIE